ncbi:MAG: Csu type fimbrial protein [Enterobacteriaceae bacterium]
MLTLIFKSDRNRYRVSPWSGLLLILFSTISWAQEGCLVSHAQNSLGSQSTENIARQAIQTEGDAGISCSFASWSSEGVEGQLISSSYNMHLSGPEGQVIPYQLYADSNYQNALTAGKSVQFIHSGPQTRSLAAGSRSLPLYIKTQPGVNVKSGAYRDSVMISWDFPRCVAWQEGECTEQQIVTERSMVDISLYADNSCSITTAPDVSFGTASFIAQFTSVAQSVQVRCTNGAPYTAYFNNGRNYNSPWRQMASGANRLQYNIYYSDGTTVWTSANPVGGRGDGSNQTLNYVAAINPAQSEKPSGSYLDTVNFTVSY